jgi:HPt (histidine-containing phosphotransfer) domain-containing protein
MARKWTEFRRDAAALRNAIHSLKGSSANIGAQSVYHACRAAEEALASGDGDIDACVKRIEEELSRACLALKHHSGGIGP